MSQMMVVIPDVLHEQVRDCAKRNGLKIKSMVIEGLKRVMADYEVEKPTRSLLPETLRRTEFHELLFGRDPVEVAALLDIPWVSFVPYVKDEKIISVEALDFMRDKLRDMP